MRLKTGTLYELDGKPWRCEAVNDCRAKLVPAWKERAKIGEREFDFTPRRSLDVSPNSILREWPS